MTAAYKYWAAFILLSLNLHLQTTHAHAEKRVSLFDLRCGSNIVFDAAPTSQLNVSSVSECVQACTTFSFCTALNFRSDLGQCDLFDLAETPPCSGSRFQQAAGGKFFADEKLQEVGGQ